MANIIGKDVNLANLKASNVYIQILDPPGFGTGSSTARVGLVGTGSWGELNKPIIMGGPQEALAKIGGVTAAALEDPHDLATDILLAYEQAQGPSSLDMVVVRVSDGTDDKATANVLDTTSGSALNGVVLTAKYSGIRGNEIKYRIMAGALTSTYTFILDSFDGVTKEVYENIPYTGAGTFWTSLANAINSGLNSLRGPSQLVVASSPNASAIAPAIDEDDLAGGTDGRDVDLSDLMGTADNSGRSGIYALTGLRPPVDIAWIVGLTDDDALPNLSVLARQHSMLIGFAIPTGTDTEDSVTLRRSSGVDNYNIAFCKDFAYFYDSVNKVTRGVAPLPVILGRTATLSPELSPLNKQVYGIKETERSLPGNGLLPYSDDELAMLEQAGIMLVTKGVPGGDYFGIRNGQNACSDPVQSGIEYSRMTNFLANTFSEVLGPFVGRKQSRRLDDPLRASIRQILNTVLQPLKDDMIIDDFGVVCDKTNNSDNTIAQGFCKVLVQVVYMATVKYLVVSTQGGVTVQVFSTLGAALAA